MYRPAHLGLGGQLPYNSRAGWNKNQCTKHKHVQSTTAPAQLRSPVDNMGITSTTWKKHPEPDSGKKNLKIKRENSHAP